MFAVAGTLFYLKTRDLLQQGAPVETMQRFWWPFLPGLLLGFLALGALVGFVATAVTQVIAARLGTTSN